RDAVHVVHAGAVVRAVAAGQVPLCDSIGVGGGTLGLAVEVRAEAAGEDAHAAAPRPEVAEGVGDAALVPARPAGGHTGVDHVTGRVAGLQRAIDAVGLPQGDQVHGVPAADDQKVG